MNDYLPGEAYERLHIMPQGDLREHRSHPSCWCEPDCRICDCGCEREYFVHHALDDRESYEEGRKMH